MPSSSLHYGAKRTIISEPRGRPAKDEFMDNGTIAIIVSVVAVGATVGIGLATLILTSSGRLAAHLTAVEKEIARLSGLLEGLGLTGRAPTGPEATGP